MATNSWSTGQRVATSTRSGGPIARKLYTAWLHYCLRVPDGFPGIPIVRNQGDSSGRPF
ncbi:MAG: hypothetical protein ABGZ35_18580 [Planctomycetaceae bacterium]